MEMPNARSGLMSLPPEVMMQIVQWGDLRYAMRLARTCKTTYRVCTPELYRLDGQKDRYAMEWACINDETETVRWALVNGPAGMANEEIEWNIEPYDLITPLVLATWHRNRKMVELLLDFGANPNTSSCIPDEVHPDILDPDDISERIPLSTEIMRTLLSRGADPNAGVEGDVDDPQLHSYLPLCLATHPNVPASMVATLLQYGADPVKTSKVAFRRRNEREFHNIVVMPIEALFIQHLTYWRNWGVGSIEAERTNLAAAKLRLLMNAIPKRQWRAQTRMPQSLSMLGVELCERPVPFRSWCQDGLDLDGYGKFCLDLNVAVAGERSVLQQWLIKCLFEGHHEGGDPNWLITDRLLDAGADPNYTEASGAYEPPLLIVSGEVDFKETVRLLLKAGADPNARGYNGNTALHYACAERSRTGCSGKVIKMLIKAGADVNAVNERGEKPLIS